MVATPLAARPADAPPKQASDDVRQEAKEHFDRGLELFNRGKWDAALAEFLRSRSLYPTRGNTRNAAVCLSKLGRNDEALDLFDKLLKEFPTLPERAQVEREVKALRALVGTIEVHLDAPGASVVVDGRVRGTTPMKSRIRVNSGSHVVRVFKEGAAPYEVRVEVAGGQNKVIEPHLTLLTRAGHLKVTESSGKEAKVIVDGVTVGLTPWEGTLEPGSHSVVLDGTGNLGTQPVRATVQLDQATVLNLGLEPLACRLRIDPVPLSSTLALDGVELGHGTWEGRLRCGRHRVEARAEGFLPVRRTVVLAEKAANDEHIELERDPESSEWRVKHPPRIFIGLEAYGLLSPTLGGDVSGSCKGSCQRSLPWGGLGQLEAGYQFASGIGLSAEVGALLVQGKVSDRSVVPREVPNDALLAGTEDDKLTLFGVTLGAAASLQRGESTLWMARLGAGVVLGTMQDRRSATIDMGTRGVHEYAQHVEGFPARYVYVSPEFRVGPRLGHFDLAFDLRPTLLIALTQPTWDRTSEQATPEPGQQIPLFHFPQESLTGTTVLLFDAGISLRYNFL